MNVDFQSAQRTGINGTLKNNEPSRSWFLFFLIFFRSWFLISFPIQGTRAIWENGQSQVWEQEKYKVSLEQQVLAENKEVTKE